MCNVWFSDGMVVPAESLYIGLLFDCSSVLVVPENGETTYTANLGLSSGLSDTERLSTGLLGSAYMEWLLGEPPVKTEKITFAVPLVDSTVDTLTNEGIDSLVTDSLVLIEVSIKERVRQFVGKYGDYCRLISNLQKTGIFILHRGWVEKKVNVNSYLDSIEDFKKSKVTVLDCCHREYYTYD